MDFFKDFGLNTVADLGMSYWQTDQASDRQTDAQQFNRDESAVARSFNSAEAALSRDWQEHMSNTQYQRGTKDMIKAGINPMLAFHQGGAGTPTGATASGPAASSGIASGGGGSTNFATASQIRVNDALTDKTRAEADEVRARTPTHTVNIDKTRQDISESLERINAIQQSVKTGASTAAHLDQQVTNLQAELPRITATIRSLTAGAKLTTAQTGKTEAETAQINQTLAQQLPQLKHALDQLEIAARLSQMPQRLNDAKAQTTLLGAIGAAARALLPLDRIMK